ncbi:dethiobiotin synthase [Phenylobacterium sp.]|jgi:dethiobiotin synthetase|uniref:dethiobiotin synthase n=1 Tax=Phenylobacterium sp. TaxID=1871053 RepID=UPI002E311A65|nr:dethiobiotin synthase [Phenylobacterium sp.]HEX4712003.1 dethiobiotin synthase [Phenylobacterium sp.]
MTAACVFVAGSHTDVGKTFVACALIRAARTAGLSVEALKPIASGFAPADWADSDPGRLLDALGRPRSDDELDRMTPWRFAAPLAPPMAATLEGRTLPLAPVVEFCAERLAASRADLFVLEGVGGLMSPLADGATGLDLMAALNLPALLVGGGYLGAISHTLTALEVLRARGQAVAAVVVSQDARPDAPDFAESAALVAVHAGATPVLSAPRYGTTDWADKALALVGDLPRVLATV